MNCDRYIFVMTLYALVHILRLEGRMLIWIQFIIKLISFLHQTYISCDNGAVVFLLNIEPKWLEICPLLWKWRKKSLTFHNEPWGSLFKKMLFVWLLFIRYFYFLFYITALVVFYNCIDLVLFCCRSYCFIGTSHCFVNATYVIYQ